jgi:hypothetical protein
MPRKAPVRRPRRANSLKDIGRILGTAVTAREQSRKDRLLAHARLLVDEDAAAYSSYWTIQTLNLFLHEYGVQLIANDRVFHIHEEWPGAIGAAWLDDGPAGKALRHLKAQGLDIGAPAPFARQGSGERRSGRQGGPTKHEKDLATVSRRKVIEAIMKLREADPYFMAKVRDEE